MTSSSLRLAAVFAALAAAIGPSTTAAQSAPKPSAKEPVAVLQTASGVMRVPLFDEELAYLPVAKVEDQGVPLIALNEALASAHQSHQGAAAPMNKDAGAVLDRLIGARLMALEAQAMGMDELEPFKKEQATFSRMALRTVVQQQLGAGAKADPAQVDALLKESVREQVIDSILFEKLEDAAAFTTAVRQGKSFEELGKAAEAAKKATGLTVGMGLTHRTNVLPQVRTLVGKLKAGETDSVKVAEGFAVVRYSADRFPETPEARAAAEQKSLGMQRQALMKKTYGKLLESLAKIDRKTLYKLNWEKNVKVFEKALTDKRVLATVQEDPEPITVADLAQEVKRTFFHSVESAIKEKRGVNEKIVGTFEDLLGRKVLLVEARHRKADESPVYKRLLADHRMEELGQLFLEKVVLPEVKVTEDAGKKYYAEHAAEFTFPAFYALQTIGFKTNRAAQAAFDKAKAGTDFKFLQQNGDGLLGPDERVFDANTGLISTGTMPKALLAQLDGTKVGDLRVYKHADGQHYLVQVKQYVPSSKKEYEKARGDIANTLMPDLIKGAIDGWVAKLRKAHKVEVYLTRIES
jgi:PPIC-type PPIASE domain